MDEDTLSKRALDADERFALMQLCSTAYLASARLNDEACVGLMRAGLALKSLDGFWSATNRGRSVFNRLEDELRGDGTRCSGSE